jgi:hypothetical protein
MRIENREAPHDVGQAVSELVGLECWYVNAGGRAGSSFSLALGQKVRRGKPLKNPDVTAEFAAFDGEASLLVWCSWRLDGPTEALTSSDEEVESLVTKLQALVGRRITGASVFGRACDLRVCFGDLVLHVFCDHVPGNPSFDGNWYLRRNRRLVSVGPGYKYEWCDSEDD